MGIVDTFLPKEDRRAALLLYGMVLATCFNGKSMSRWHARRAWLTFRQDTMLVS